MTAGGGPVALVTGAAGGLGRALVRALLAAGYRVMATDVDPQALRATRDADGWDPERTKVRPLDVCAPADWSLAFDAADVALGPVDVLINNAGFLAAGWMHTYEAEVIARQMDVNAKGVALGMHAAAQRMVPRKAGHIVNIGSLAALAPISGLAVYSASKYAVRALSLAGAIDLEPHGVSVSVVCPGAIQTAMLDKQVDREEAALTFSGGTLDPVEVARIIVHEVMVRRPRERYLPRGRGWLARVADVFPRLGAMFDGPMRRKGNRNRGR